MRVGRREPLMSPDPQLDPYRTKVAELTLDGTPDGLLATRVEVRWSEQRGHLWWKRWTRPYETLVWEVSQNIAAEEPLYADGVDHLHPGGQTLADELASGVFTLAGKSYLLRWLKGDELGDALTVMGLGSN